MKVAIFGGESCLGIHLAKQAVSAGYSVSLLVSQLATSATQRRLEYICGSLDDTGAVESTLAGADAVVVIDTTGHTVTAEDMERLLVIMGDHMVRRLVVATDRPPEISAATATPWWRVLVGGQEQQPQEVFECIRRSNFDWTILHATGFKNEQPQPSMVTAVLLRQQSDVPLGPLAESDFARHIFHQMTDASYVQRSAIVGEPTIVTES